MQTILTEFDANTAEKALLLRLCGYILSTKAHPYNWGPVPYFKAGEAAEGVPYDAQNVIYDDMFKKLDKAITVLKGKVSETPFGSFDLIYGGNVSKWIKFGNTLRLRLAVRVSNVDPSRAKTEGEVAVSSGTLQTSCR